MASDPGGSPFAVGSGIELLAMVQRGVSTLRDRTTRAPSPRSHTATLERLSGCDQMAVERWDGGGGLATP